MKIKPSIFLWILLSIQTLTASLPQPAESYYTIKDFGAPHFNKDSLSLDTDSFVELVNEVNLKTHDRAFIIEVPNELYSSNIQKLRAAQFFHYFDYPEHNSSVWCRTNGSGIPLAGSHTLGARSIVYYKENSEYYFLLIKDVYSFKEYEFPGGYIQPDDKDITNSFEKYIYSTDNLNYRSPQETAVSETLEETGFNLVNYGYGPQGSKKPLTIAQVYTKNTRPDRGIHSMNDCCQYLLFKVTPNKDKLKKQEHEIADVLWASYTDIINDKIQSPINIHSVTDNAKNLIQRVVASEIYKETRSQLTVVNRDIQSVLSSIDPDCKKLLELTKKQLDLIKNQRKLETKLRQRNWQDGKKFTTYFTPL